MTTAPHGSTQAPGPTFEPAEAGSALARIPTLDGLRSLVIIVLLVHFTDSVELSAVGRALFATGQVIGGIGLDVFFVLSGFLITSILLETKDRPGYFRNFYARRILRIFPLYYGFLIVFFLVMPAVSPRFETISATEHLYYWGYLINIAKSLDWPVAPSTGHFWSLAVEEQFYVFWPALVYWCTRDQLRRWCLVMMAAGPIIRLALAVMWPESFAFHQLFRFDVLAIGGVIAVSMRSPAGLEAVRRWVWPAAGVAVAATTIATFAAPLRVTLAVLSSGCAYVAAAAFFAVLVAPPASWLARVVGSWPLRRIGMYSYAIYVLHDPLVDVFARYGIVDMPQRGDVEALIYCAVMVPICVAAGALSWHFFERPFLRLKHVFAYAARATPPRRQGAG